MGSSKIHQFLCQLGPYFMHLIKKQTYLCSVPVNVLLLCFVWLIYSFNFQGYRTIFANLLQSENYQQNQLLLPLQLPGTYLIIRFWKFWSCFIWPREWPYETLFGVQLWVCTIKKPNLLDHWYYGWKSESMINFGKTGGF